MKSKYNNHANDLGKLLFEDEEEDLTKEIDSAEQRFKEQLMKSNMLGSSDEEEDGI